MDQKCSVVDVLVPGEWLSYGGGAEDVYLFTLFITINSLIRVRDFNRHICFYALLTIDNYAAGDINQLLYYNL